MMRSILTTIAVTAVCGITACAPARSQSATGPDTARIQSRLTASEEKVAQLSQQVALLQMMVDSHQRTLQDIEDDGVGAAETPHLPAAPVPALTAEDIPATEASAPPAPVSPQAPPRPEAPSDIQGEPIDQPPVTDPEPSSDTPSPQYQQAMEVFKSGDYDSAVPLFEAFAAEFKDDDLADNALYWAGECKYARKEFTEAIQRFKRVVEEYPNGSKVPDALLKIGFAYISLGDRESATTYLKRVVAQYPFSSAGAKAEARLKTLR